jgi:hypothetical protein
MLTVNINTMYERIGQSAEQNHDLINEGAIHKDNERNEGI